MTHPEMNWQKRAEAAQKTVDVLKKKVLELYNDGAQTAIHQQLERAQRRQEKNRQRQAMMEMRAAELQKYSQGLEAEVARRTHELKNILDNVTFGFLVVDQELNIQPGSTRSCTELLDAEELTGINLCDALHINSDKERANYWLGIDQIFEDLMPEELSLAQLPQRFPIGERVLRVEGGTIRDPETDEVAGLLMTISDITSLEAAERENYNNQVLISLLKQKEAFRAFLQDTRTQIGSAREVLEHETYVRRVVHTIKGNSASYGLNTVATLIHELEERPTITHEELRAIEDSVRAYLEKNFEVLEINYDSLDEDTLQVSNEHMNRLRTLLDGFDAGDNFELRRWTAQVFQKPVSHLLGPIEDLVAKLSARLEKDIEFTLHGTDIEVDPDTMLPVVQTLVHLIRNSVDHGIEASWERGNKSPTGKVALTFKENSEAYTIVVQDDGRGIDLAKLTQRALNKKLVTHQQVDAMSRSEILGLIFKDGLSTAEEATDISGRGVGMSAVLSEVKKCYGEIKIDSVVGAGTTFTLVIPKPQILQNTSDLARTALLHSASGQFRTR